MPSPIGHSLAGLTVHLLSARDEPERRSLARAAIVVGAAMAADLDLLLRFIDGRNHHQAEFHSVGAAVLAGLLTALAARGLGRSLSLGMACGAAWLSHVFLDYFSSDTHPPIGLMALWPVSREYLKSPWLLFLDIGRTLEWETVRNNILAAAWEVVLLSPILLVSWRFRPGRRA